MAEIVLTGMEGHKVSLRSARPSDAEGMWQYVAALSVPGGEITTEVWDYKRGLGRFFRELADAWKGFKGVKEYASLEGELLIRCRHDGKGTVECEFTLRHPEPPAWRFEAGLQFGAGAHLDEIADEVEGFERTSFDPSE